MRAFRLALAAVVLLAGAGACTSEAAQRVQLRIVASSELEGVRPLLAELSRDTGVDVTLDVRAGLDMLPPAGLDKSFDAAWLTTGAYQQLQLRGADRPLATPTMLSPVVIGVRPTAAAALRSAAGGAALTWADVADAAASGALRLAMADPSQGGSGLAALIGVATAAAGTGSALRPEDVTCDRLRGFFAGRSLTGPTFATLADDFVKRQDELDALVGEESALLKLNDSGQLKEKLELVYPADGIIQADYPLQLLRPEARAAYDKVIGWLMGAQGQKRLTETTLRRPFDPRVARDLRLQRLAGTTLFYPDQVEVVDKLLSDYADPRLSMPDHVFFVLDFSGSMRGERIAALRATFAGLSGADRSASGKFFRFYRGERFTVVRFGGTVLGEQTFTVENQGALDQLGGFIAADEFDDSTAVWSALDHADIAAAAAATDRPVAVVLMTDGLSNAGMGLDEFLARHDADPARKVVPTYAIRYGEADAAELDRAAKATGGRMVDANAVSLLDAFKEIRGCH
ncbi:substrate-binding domain-containing protein [Dactylosporangium matsuzakiense]|uniref:VWA domain-containing protein n=1 Tax=Dactylosporangium matsuzakiense TaxID=53360 RepID=A0A9W6KPX5_9ACTN|nr:substrate-binding domain-containing protein [Dactylosporangium matsuzakiense]UWZ44178.1 substrate-binding domain-containing protein [Dactylosporangium matsuzakiense]GLL03384.1 VWA domain-containing protein [Dactylosporangium matsuzakiense]